MIGYLRLPLSWIAHSDRVGIPLMRVAIAIVFLWIGALKFAPYEADSITPFVANSPFIEKAITGMFTKYCPGCKVRVSGVNPADWATKVGPTVQPSSNGSSAAARTTAQGRPRQAPGRASVKPDL